MKRVLCLILAVVIIISLVAIPAMAADPTDYNYKYNILPYVDTFCWYDGDFYSETFVGSVVVPGETFINDGNVGWYESLLTGEFSVDFYNDSDLFMEFGDDSLITTSGHYVFTFYSNTAFNSCTFVYYNYNGHSEAISCSISSVVLGNGYFLNRCSFTLDDYIDNTNFSFNLTYNPESVHGNLLFSIEEFSCINSLFYNIPSVNITAVGTAHNRNDASYYQQTYINNVFYHFYEGPWFRLTSENTADLPSDDQINFVSTFSTGVKNAKYFSYTFYSTGVWPNYYDPDSLTNASLSCDGGSIPYTAIVTQLADTVLGLSYDGLPVYKVTIYAELPSDNIGNIEFNTMVNARYPNTSTNNFKVYGYMPLEAYFVFDFEDESLTFIDNFIRKLHYLNETQVLPAVYNWILMLEHTISNIWNECDSLLTSIKTHCNNIYVRIGTINTNLTTFYQRFVTNFNSLFDKLDEYFGVPDGTAPPDISDQQQGIQDSIDDMDGISDGFASAGDQIDELLPSLPSYDDTGLHGFADIAASHILVIKNVFNVLWANDFIIQLLTFSCLLSLGGFILFGER